MGNLFIKWWKSFFFSVYMLKEIINKIFITLISNFGNLWSSNYHKPISLRNFD